MNDIDSCKALLAILDACNKPSMRWAVVLNWLLAARAEKDAEIDLLKKELLLWKKHQSSDDLKAMRASIERKDRQLNTLHLRVGKLRKKLCASR